jgi:hypothetical protein
MNKTTIITGSLAAALAYEAAMVFSVRAPCAGIEGNAPGCRQDDHTELQTGLDVTANTPATTQAEVRAADANVVITVPHGSISVIGQTPDTIVASSAA